MPVLELREIRATSPTLAETMRACPLRAALSRTSGSSDFVLGSPKAWLGTAYHEVLEKIVDHPVGESSVEDAVNRIWDRAISAQQARAAAHALDGRFGPPATWPGYHVARASALLRAQELVAKQMPAAPVSPPRSGARGSVREQELAAFSGKLVGRPDVIRGDEVVDYKSGAILEYDSATDSDVVKAAYVRQLRIYGFLVRENLGWWPRRGTLLPLGGAGVELSLEPAECERDAAAAVSLLDEYNAKREEVRSVEDLATPSTAACKWCPFKVICPAFWRTASPSWSGHLDGAAIEGNITESVQWIHGGAALAVSIDVLKGSEPMGRMVIAPLNPSIHTAAANLVSGDDVRVVALRVRPDGQLVPGVRTVLTRVADLPSIELRGQGHT